MSAKPIINARDDNPVPIPVVGMKVSILASQSETNGQGFTIQSGEEGMGPPPHSHGWSESFFVLKGSVEINCGGVSRVCEAGGFVFVPPGVVHSFKFGPDGGEMFEVTGDGSRAAQLFRDLSEKLDPGPPDIQKVIEIFKHNGATVHL